MCGNGGRYRPFDGKAQGIETGNIRLPRSNLPATGHSLPSGSGSGGEKIAAATRVHLDHSLSAFPEYRSETQGRDQGITGKISSVYGLSTRRGRHARTRRQFFCWFSGMTKIIRHLIRKRHIDVWWTFVAETIASEHRLPARLFLKLSRQLRKKRCGRGARAPT